MTGPASPARAWWATTPLSGAIGILHLAGDCAPVLKRVAGRAPAPGTTALLPLAGVDEGLVARPGETCAMIMPHGGPQIRRRLTAEVIEAGATLMDPFVADPRESWPEAEDLVEACMLEALARTSSPLGVDLLLRQPAVHRAARATGWRPSTEDAERARRLAPLVDPPLIVITGAPNAGKSTLLNRLAGREVAITADLAGTTRDAVSAQIVLGGVACTLVDLPGERRGGDPVERQAIALGRRFIEQADLLIALVTPERPEPPGQERLPDLVVTNKIDLGGVVDEPAVSALDGTGIDALVETIRDRLLPGDQLEDREHPWCFHPALLET